MSATRPVGMPGVGHGFDWADAFRLEDQLGAEERMIRDSARGFASDVLQPRVIEAYLGHGAAARLAAGELHA